MKKQLFVLLTLFGTFSIANAQINWGDKFIEFKQLGKDHKMEWCDFMMKMKNQKMELKKKHKSAWFDYKINMLTQWKDTEITSQADKDVLFKEQLTKALAMRKEQAKECKELYESFFKEGNNIFNKQQEGLMSFEESITPKVEAAEIETAEE
ncbi:MAG: hypothetical protein WDZ41_05695 [Candidatus Babeliales bacterium]